MLQEFEGPVVIRGDLELKAQGTHPSNLITSGNIRATVGEISAGATLTSQQLRVHQIIPNANQTDVIVRSKTFQIKGTINTTEPAHVQISGDLTVGGDILLQQASIGLQGVKEAMSIESIGAEAEVNSPLEAGNDSASSEISLAQKLADIDARTQRIESVLNTLVRFTSRLSDGRTLVNAVGVMDAKVDRLVEHL